MRDDLFAAADPVLAAVREHPFWAGVRNGTLPPASLWYFAAQDTWHVVPAYARALARAAAIAEEEAHGALLCAAADATFSSLTRLREGLGRLAVTLGPGASATAAVPATLQVHAHSSFLLAAPTASFAAGIGGLLPMTWFHLKVSDDLRDRRVPGSCYAAWISQYCPADGYRNYVAAYLDMIDEVADRCSARERAELTVSFAAGAHYEWAFAEAAWRLGA